MQNQPLVPGASPNPTPAPTPAPTPNPQPTGVPNVMPDPLDMPRGSVVEPLPAQPFGPSAPGTLPLNATTVTSTPTPAPATPARRPANRNLIETIVLVVVSVIAVVFIGLFIWKYIEWDSVKTDVDGQINRAVALAVSENTTKLEDEFVEREKYPYKSFMGPIDYGSVSFEYPKTWNVYIARDASNGGDFEAYFNPGEVQPVSSTTINALRFTIRDASFENVTRTYDSFVRSGRLSIVTRNVGAAVANVYTGELSNSIHGVLAVFKLRDKTVLIQTDAELFSAEFYKLLDTVTFVE